MLDLGIVKKDFSSLVGNIHPWMLSHFVMWLDIKVAEFKVYGHMVLDDTPNDTPKWLRGQRPQESTANVSNSSDINVVWSGSEGSANKQILTLQDGGPSPAKQVRIKLHDQTSVQQSNQIPQGHNITHRPLPNLTRQPQIYTEGTAVNSNNKRQHTSPNNTSSDISHKKQGHLEETQLLQDIQVSQIELQKRWAQEIEKCVSQTGVTSIKAPEVQPEPSSRTTIVLKELPQQQNDSELHNITFESSQQGSSKNNESQSLKISDENVIKIELSSDDESQSSNHFPQGETTETCNASQGEIISQDLIGFSLQESDLKEVSDDTNPVPVSMYSSVNRTPPSSTGKDEEASWRTKKWHYFENLRKNQSSNYVGAKAHSLTLQNFLPFPDPFPLENLSYGLRAQEMIDSGNITRAGKMQFLDTVFNEVVKYTGLYPSPQQRHDIAKAIVTSFPKLNNCDSAEDQWIVIINDKFRNERRMLHHGPYLSRQRIPGLQYSRTNTEMKDDS